MSKSQMSVSFGYAMVGDTVVNVARGLEAKKMLT